MNFRIKLFLVTGFIIASIASDAQNIWTGFEHLFMPSNNYVAHSTTGKIEIDGKATEADWAHAQWSEYHKDIEGDSKPAPLFQTRVKMLWNNTNLYILAELEEPHIWAYYDKHDMIVFHENDIEVFIDPDRDSHNYYEFEVNAQNTLFDLFMNKPYRNGGRANIPWNAKGFKSAVHLNGTLNDPNDIDRGWTVEMAIPFASLTTNGDFLQPENGDVFKINFSRVNWQTDIINGKYVRKKDPETKKKLPEFNWVWSPQGVINMHYPERWSMVQFSEKPVTAEKEEFQLPVEEVFSKYLWLIYYKQLVFTREFGVYAPTLQRLGIPETGTVKGDSYQIGLETDVHKYSATLETVNGLVISINQTGLIEVIHK